jgi:radical SAM enzyme (TIGR01210 family)
VSSGYPLEPSRQDSWILSRRGSRNVLDPRRAYATLIEEEPDDTGRPVSVATIFLSNRECPWRCLMCDLWRNTLPGPVPPGAIPEQIARELSRLAPARWIKLYNAGSFFDPKAIPPEDHAPVARLLSRFGRVIVESHPALCGETCLEFRDRVEGSLEVALGLETVHPDVLPRLNKRMTLESFRMAARFLDENRIGVRAFVLVGLPFVAPEEAVPWACRSVAFAFECGARVVSLIPTRTGNGALDALQERGEFTPPDLTALEEALAQGLAVSRGLALARGRVLADLWDLEKFSRCGACFAARASRLRTMNLIQRDLPRVSCAECGARG